MPSFCPNPPFSIRSTTRRDKFVFSLAEMSPWVELQGVIRAHYPRGKGWNYFCSNPFIYPGENLRGIFLLLRESSGFMDVRTRSKQKEL